MTLNGKIALILRYCTEFDNLRRVLRKSGCKSHNYVQFTITLSSSKRLQRDRATLTAKVFYNCKVEILVADS